MPTQAEIGAAITAIKAIADTIKELGEVPSGHLYAGLTGKLDLQQYEKIIDILVRGGLVAKRGQLLVWKG